MHAHLKVLGGEVMLLDEFAEYGQSKALPTLGGTTFNMVAALAKARDVDAAIAKAEAAGASVAMPAADMFWGACFGMVRDTFGHLWAFNADVAS
ncbi:MAG: hypothetical protein FJX21_18580 [Alphaproteobacteria bacterium]|nr:hypothetical protein [Alphaproteobacteria bacterium]